jgi:hypothetical protein
MENDETAIEKMLEILPGLSAAIDRDVKVPTRAMPLLM